MSAAEPEVLPAECTDHVHPGRIRAFLATVLIRSLRRLLWGFDVFALPPCMAGQFYLYRASSAVTRPIAPPAQPTQLPAQSGQYL
jgi:hypothetical protein